ncbi:hypothetical protein [Sulfitobacter mediterraneus]|uniref:Uncharacterized protein n=1 Tax=Sulfitobacter mediterraneus TaxID=83219 RepID=A0A2T6CCJ6_9RHOB|nr:hypothetical protein [Sulfitobacter mediterraneus]PTX73191.1 hypothetical protein C8N31_10899 [Sulfitobacter mediterraneus]
MIWEHLTPEDSNKAKKSLIVVACCTLIFATFEFNENVLRFLNLELVVSQEKIVRLGQYSCLVLLAIFVLRELPNYISKLGTLSFEREEKLQDKETKDYHFDYYGHTQPETSQEAILEELKDQQRIRTNRLKSKYQRLYFLFAVINVGVVDLLFPISMGLLVFFDPYFLDFKVSDQPLQ